MLQTLNMHVSKWLKSMKIIFGLFFSVASSESRILYLNWVKNKKNSIFKAIFLIWNYFFPLSDTQYLCRISNQCVNGDHSGTSVLCDGNNDCGYFEDEMGCTTACNIYQLTCANGNCVDTGLDGSSTDRRWSLNRWFYYLLSHEVCSNYFDDLLITRNFFYLSDVSSDQFAVSSAKTW